MAAASRCSLVCGVVSLVALLWSSGAVLFVPSTFGRTAAGPKAATGAPLTFWQGGEAGAAAQAEASDNHLTGLFFGLTFGLLISLASAAPSHALVGAEDMKRGFLFKRGDLDVVPDGSTLFAKLKDKKVDAIEKENFTMGIGQSGAKPPSSYDGPKPEQERFLQAGLTEATVKK